MALMTEIAHRNLMTIRASATILAIAAARTGSKAAVAAIASRDRWDRKAQLAQEARQVRRVYPVREDLLVLRVRREFPAPLARKGLWARAVLSVHRVLRESQGLLARKVQPV